MLRMILKNNNNQINLVSVANEEALVAVGHIHDNNNSMTRVHYSCATACPHHLQQHDKGTLLLYHCSFTPPTTSVPVVSKNLFS